MDIKTKDQLVEVKRILSLPIEDRIDAIIHSPNPAELVHAMPEEQVWLTIKKLGERESLSLIALTSVDQLQYILDVELWKKDRHAEARSLEWLSLLKECGDKKVLQWAREADSDSVVLTFLEHVHIEKKQAQDDDPLEREWLEEFPVITMDGMYYFQALSQAADEVVRPVLAALAKDDHEFFQKLCEVVISELRSNLEEEAFSWRTKRLSEKGFVSLEEALSVYSYLNDRQIASLPRRSAVESTTTVKQPVYPLALGGESYPIFMLALSGIKDERLKENIFNELAAIANKVIVADGRAITPETIESSLKKVMGFVNIGLERLSGADPHKAATVLNERWLLHLFQVGFSVVSKLRQMARKFVTAGWPSAVGGDLNLLDEPLALSVHGVLKKRPMYFAEENAEGEYRDFKSIDEVREVERYIERAEYIGSLFANVFKLSPADVQVAVEGREDFHWSNVLLNIWAKGSATGNYKFSPVTEDEMQKVLKNSWSSSDMESSIRSFKTDIADKFLHWLFERQPKMNSNDEKHCRIFVEECFNKFLEEFGELLGDEPLDSRYIQSIWVVPKID